MELTEFRFGDRQKKSFDEGLKVTAESGADTTDRGAELRESVAVGLFHDPLDGAGSRSLPTSPLRVDARGYGR